MDIPKKEIRLPIVDGLFYPDDPRELEEKTRALLKEGEAKAARILLCPHGSWEHCGNSLGAAFAAASLGRPDRIVMIAAVHREKDATALALPGRSWFGTPLGPQPVDRKLRNALGGDLYAIDDIPHGEEHSLELTLPFLRVLFPDTPILPVLTGNLKRSLIRKAASRLTKELGRRGGTTLFVISANLSGYAPAEKSAGEAEAFLERLQLPLQESLLEKETAEQTGSCGSVPLTLLSDLLERTGTDNPLQREVLRREKAEHRDREVLKAVHYGALCWL